MNQRRHSILVGFLIGMTLPAAALAQDVQRVTLDEALRIFAERNLELRLARATATEVAGLSRQASAFPNPIAYVTHENVSTDALGGASLAETYVGVNQEISWPWRQSASGGAADHTANAALAGIARDSLRLAFEVKQAFAGAGAAEQRTELILRVRDVIRDVERAGTARFDEGDISGYELRRMRMELARYETLAAQASIEMQRIRRTLALLVLGDAEGQELAPVRTLAGLPSRPSSDFETTAVQQRPEIVASRESALAAENAAGFARASRFPNPTVSGAYKTQTGGFNGVFLGLSWPVPIFNGNGQAVVANEARVEAATRREDLARQIVLADVRNAVVTFDAIAANGTVISERLLVDPETILVIATESYGEGAMSLIELLDAAEAYWEAGQISIETRSRAWIAYFNLERAVGGFGSTVQEGQ